MGLAVAAVYIILGLSYLIRSFIPIHNCQLTYLITISLACLAYASLPLAVSFGIKNIAVLFIISALFGLFQSSSWPVMLKIISKYFDPRNDGSLMGLWSSHGDIGNIFGFFSYTVIVFYLKLPW